MRRFGVAEQRARGVHREVPVTGLLLAEEPASVDAVLVGELLRLRGREAADVSLAPLALEPLGRGVGPDDPADLVQVVLEAEGLERLLVVLPLRVPHHQSRATRVPLAEVIRARGDDRGLDALRRDGRVRRHSREELHRHPRQEVTRRLLENDAERAGVDRLVARDVIEERRRRRLHRGSESAGESPGEVRGRHGLTVVEPEALLDPERVGAAVAAHGRHALRRHRREPGAGRALLVRVVHQPEVRGGHHVPRVAEVREAGIDVVEVGTARDGERSSDPLRRSLRATRGGPCKQCGREQRSPDRRHGDRSPDASCHLSPFRVHPAETGSAPWCA